MTQGKIEFNFAEFLREGYSKQEKYAAAAGQLGPIALEEKLRMADPEDVGALLQFRFQKVIEYIGHMMEELTEARVYVPRRSWKTQERSFMDSPELRKEFIVELYDVLLFFRATLAYAGISPEELLEAIELKDQYNSNRPDHNLNQTYSHRAPHPVDELRGECCSAKNL